MNPELHIIYPESALAWRQWLSQHHETNQTVWVACAKKQASKYTLNHAEAVAEALCFGWIDGTTRSLNAEYFIQSFTKRKSKSMWCRANKEKVAELTANGLMQPAGLAAVHAAKKNGYWTILDEVEALKIPADLRHELHTDMSAEAFFDKLSNSDKKRLLTWLVLAKRPETRAQRIREIVSCAAAGLKPGLLAR
ncbi:hypothetical protein C7T94_04075 [Pedobacter yulinensis]|uniref:Bacteriocin-protection protein n=1 Tax=Pedobacter yulinensis TaxID=2126353 RepID=A0A2T3HPX2_9SPHI|nr:YdeI/OmpD-associated family protein [Pedobacter yulinensis]PST84494.1 hypothetical protein C7T94_04075 [Pedobacter yulinensis]